MNRTLARLLAACSIVLATVLTLAGCGLSSGGSATYTPAAYYQTIGGVAECYYVQTPLEVTDLIQAGLCPAHSVAVRMPLSWEEEYWAYYSSPAYYDTYMPTSYRSRYTSVTVISFSKTYSKQISSAETKATYKSSSGGTVKGTTSKLKFGSGSGSSTVHGGGSGRGAAACSFGMTTLQDKSGTSSSSHGGGSGRSGTSSGSKTTTKTTTRTGSKTGSGSGAC